MAGSSLMLRSAAIVGLVWMVSSAPALAQSGSTGAVTRNFTQIIGLSPGITSDVTDAGALGRGAGGTSPPNAHGDRSYDNNFQMNGLGVNDIFSQGTTSGGVPIPNPDTILEFKVQTGQYDAAFGRNAGANVNLVTKSGSNTLNGSAFEFFRNRA